MSYKTAILGFRFYVFFQTEETAIF